jgi:hypothetical protein
MWFKNLVFWAHSVLSESSRNVNRWMCSYNICISRLAREPLSDNSENNIWVTKRSNMNSFSYERSMRFCIFNTKDCENVLFHDPIGKICTHKNSSEQICLLYWKSAAISVGHLPYCSESGHPGDRHWATSTQHSL